MINAPTSVFVQGDVPALSIEGPENTITLTEAPAVTVATGNPGIEVGVSGIQGPQGDIGPQGPPGSVEEGFVLDGGNF